MLPSYPTPVCTSIALSLGTILFQISLDIKQGKLSILSSKVMLTIFKTSLFHMTIRISVLMYQQVQLDKKKEIRDKTITFADDKVA